MRSLLSLSSVSMAFVVAGALSACSSSSDSSGGGPPGDTGADVSVPLGDPQCVGQSLGLSRPVTGIAGGVQSVFTLTSHSVFQSPSPTGDSSMIAQITGGKLELHWLGTIPDGTDAQVTGGVLAFPGDDPAPAGAFCVLPGTVLHKTATGGRIDFVVTDGTSCATSPGDAGTSDASSSSTVAMKGCIVFTP